MKKTCTIGFLFLLLSGLAFGQGLSIKMKFSFFVPQENYFESIYGGGFTYGTEIDIVLWKKIDLWASGYFFSKQGELTFTKDPTDLKIFPIEWGLRYRFLSKRINLYAGIGLGYVSLKESNFIGDVSTRNMGWNLGLGGFVTLFQNLILDVFVRYSWCIVNPASIKVNIGGYDIGMGIGYSFGGKRSQQ